MPVPSRRTVVMSRAQERLWFLDRLAAGGAAYHVAVAERFTGPLDAVALERALTEVVARHEALRTVFPEIDGAPAAVVRAAGPVGVELVEATEGGLPGLLAERANRPFDLGEGPLLRVSLLRLAPDEHVLLMVLHHIVCDAWSLERILYPELSALYDAFAAGTPPPPAAGAPPYSACALRMRERDHAADLDFWRGELAGAPALELPADRPRPPAPTGAGGLVIHRMPRELWTRVEQLARAERCTPFMVVTAACQVLLARHSGQDDFCVGTPVAGRDEVEFEHVFGLFMNTLAVRADLTGDPTVRDLVRRVRRRVLRAFMHGTVPFDEVVAALRATGEQPPPLQAILNLDNPGEGLQEATDPLRLAGLARRPVESGLAPAKSDLAVDVVVYPAELRFIVTYDADLFERATAERMAGHLERLLAEMAERPQARLSELRMLAPEELAVVLPGPRGHGGTGHGPADHGPVDHGGAEHDGAGHGPVDHGGAGPVRLDRMIEEQAARTPGAPAVVTPDRVLTYAQLDEQATALASELDVPPGSLVGLRMRAGPEAVVALLAALKAGAAYVPVDPALPPARTRLLLDGCAAVVDEDGLTRLPGRASVDGAAYVIYTSGSTGIPKGVVVGHRTVANLAVAFRDVHGFGPGQRVLVVPPLSFDASAGDIYPALVSGAALVLHPDPASLDGPALLRLCAELDVTMVDTACALWRQWVEDLSALERVDVGPLTTMMVGGESVPVDRLRAWARLTGGAVAFYNHYGPTEATVCATVYRTVDGAELGGRTHLPIGSPLPHVRAYVLDRHGGPAPIGAPGELHLGGDCLARGYLGDPERTTERFRPAPFAPGGTLYATGDLVRRRADGTLDFLGRTDRQLKVNGVRVEPGEVEAACLVHPDVKEAVVAAPGGRLVAYLVTAPAEPPVTAPVTVPAEPPVTAPAEALFTAHVTAPTTAPLTAAGLRAFLADRLPPSLLPSAVVTLDALPLTPNGKIDYPALPEPERGAPPYQSPATPTERAVAAVWEEVLGVRAGRHDGFFDLGGHSLLTPRTVARLREETGVRLPLATFFACADLAELAAAIDGRAPRARPDLRADAALPSDFAVAQMARTPRRGPPRRILLTGATGFLGAHLLADLLARSGATVHCLVRGARPAERIRRALQARGLWHDGLAARIVAEPGDLAGPLPEPPGDLDLIVHCGGLVDFTLPYGRLRPANVDGTLAVLRLAAPAAAPVHLVSTLGVYLTPGERLVREGDPLPDPEGLHLGYDQSKWVADRLAAAAREAGLPVSIHRPARICGDSRTGRTATDDFLARFLATCALLGTVPDGEHLDLAPVDHVAAAIGHLARTGAEGDFHYRNPRTLGSADVAAGLAERGIPVRLVPGHEWRAEVRRRLDAGQSLPLAPFPAFVAEYGDERGPGFDCAATESLLAGAGLVCPPAATLIGGYLDHLIDAGVLPGGGRA